MYYPHPVIISMFTFHVVHSKRYLLKLKLLKSCMSKSWAHRDRVDKQLNHDQSYCKNDLIPKLRYSTQGNTSIHYLVTSHYKKKPLMLFPSRLLILQPADHILLINSLIISKVHHRLSRLFPHCLINGPCPPYHFIKRKYHLSELFCHAATLPSG